MERTQELFEKIEGYLAQTLSEEEVLAFEKEIAEDSELERELEKQRELHRVLSDRDTLNFKEKLQKISAEVKKEQLKSNTYFSYWKIAASIIIILGVGTLLWNNLNKTDSFSELYASYYRPYPAEDVTRGDTANEWDDIVKNYSKGNYDTVISKLEKTISISASEQFRLYLGNSYLNSGKEQEAILQFEMISDASRYREAANWYRSLTHLKLGEIKKSSEILKEIINYNGVYKEKAMQLKAELKE
ncbi:hypothetical protein D1818_16285 [Aquimarina sp. BL5]|uniref:tetratricopeptide repeat protein n=1 Tax=Aquimarina sp. BL5 TaxID=1714860 RepID=UPI000E4B9787|nr:hypothetical protein [Aquimarina sp. BL5]AXT52322.1 hypothetical protein D1818_16285 [Aquimarina sp. BL5]RKN09994.1 hypothetical protein D7036_03490 [Aquimarina sp. BL5]